MGRKNTKAKQALAEIEAQMSAAQVVVDELQAKLAVAQTELRVYGLTYHKLLRHFQPSAPQPCQSAATNSGMARAMKDSLSRAAKSTSKKSSTKKRAGLPEICAGVIKFDGGDRACDATENDGIHDPTLGYAGYHPFVSSAANARPLSSANGAGVSSTANSETQADSVGGAVPELRKPGNESSAAGI